MTITRTSSGGLLLVDSDGDELCATVVGGNLRITADEPGVIVPADEARMFAARLFRLTVTGEHEGADDELPTASPMRRAITALRTAADELEQLPDEVRRQRYVGVQRHTQPGIEWHTLPGIPITGRPQFAIGVDAIRQEADHLEQLLELVTDLNTPDHERNPK